MFLVDLLHTDNYDRGSTLLNSSKTVFQFLPSTCSAKTRTLTGFSGAPCCYGYYDNKSFIIFFVTNLKVDTPLKQQNFAGRRYGFLRRIQYKKDISQSGGDPINARVVHLHWQAGSFVHFSTKRILAKSKHVHNTQTADAKPRRLNIQLHFFELKRYQPWAARESNKRRKRSPSPSKFYA